jgi:Mn-dependent DtxR family transcriptional regulator
MLENSFATLTPDGYALTDKGRRLARRLTALQRLFAIKQSG